MSASPLFRPMGVGPGIRGTASLMKLHYARKVKRLPSADRDWIEILRLLTSETKGRGLLQEASIEHGQACLQASGSTGKRVMGG